MSSHVNLGGALWVLLLLCLFFGNSSGGLALHPRTVIQLPSRLNTSSSQAIPNDFPNATNIIPSIINDNATELALGGIVRGPTCQAGFGSNLDVRSCQDAIAQIPATDAPIFNSRSGYMLTPGRFSSCKCDYILLHHNGH